MEPLRDQPPDLRSLLRALWRRKWLFLSILISIPVVVYVISSLVTKTYEASAVVKLEPIRTDVPSLTAPGVADADTEALLLNLEKVATEAAAQLGGDETPQTVAGSILTQAFQTDAATTDLLSVIGQADTGERAAAVANAYADAIDTVRTDKALKQLDKSIANVEAQEAGADDPTIEAELARQLQLLRGARDATDRDTQVVQAAFVPDTPVSPHPRRNTALAALVALLIALGAVALAERFDRRLRDSSELESLLDAPQLSVIPRGAFPGERPAPGPVREAFRTLAASLLYFNVEQPIETVIVASPTKGDGKTTVAVHLAVALARDGKRAILVDCDLRHPQVAVRLGIEPGAGVVEVLTGQASLDDALVDLDVGDGTLEVLTAGKPPPNPGRLLGSNRMDSLLKELSRRAEIVVVDTPPILNVSDAVPLLERVSGTVVVAKVGGTGKDALQRLRQVIETARGNILGAVATGSASAGLYGYGMEYYGDETVMDLESPLPEPSARQTDEWATKAPSEPEPPSEQEPAREPDPVSHAYSLPDADALLEGEALLDHETPPEAQPPLEAETPLAPQEAPELVREREPEEVPAPEPEPVVGVPEPEDWQAEESTDPAHDAPAESDVREPAEPVSAWRRLRGGGNGQHQGGREPAGDPADRDQPQRQVAAPVPPVDPTSIVDQPTQEWSAAEESEAGEEWVAPAEWDVPEGWNAPEDWDEPEEWDSGEE